MMGLTVCVCGGRDYADRERVFSALDAVHSESKISYVMHGCAKGADSLADAWANERGILVEKYPALWDEHGRAAGPIRNQLMLDDGRPDLVIAFPGGRGTADMVQRTKAAGVRLIEIRP